MSKYKRYIKMLENKGLLNDDLPEVSIIQLVGDRDNPSISLKEFAFTIPANPMSDRGQMVLIKGETIPKNTKTVKAKEDYMENYTGEKIKVFESFSGYGSQRMALRNLGVNFTSVGISEIDVPAILSYASIHDGLSEKDDDFVYPSKEDMIKFLENKNIGLDFKSKKVKLPKNLVKLKQLYRAVVLSKCFGDISLIDCDDLPDMDLFTYSFPCTDISVAGQQQGVIKGKTRSGLLYECEKIIEVKRPKYLLLENVKNLVGKKFKEQFDEWLEYLESLGYTNYWQVLNAKDHGVPQNRERVFVVSILDDEDKNYVFPQKQPLDIRLKDVLESQVEDKYYLSDEVQARFKPNDKFKDMSGNIVGTTAPDFRTIGQRDLCYQENSIMGTLVATDYKQPKQIVERIGGCFDDEKSTHQAGSVYNKEGLSPTLDTMQGGYRQPCILNEKIQDEKSHIEELLKNTNYSRDFGSKGKVQNNEGICSTLLTAMGSGGGNIPIVYRQYRIRKLTPKECWRLMGCSDEDFEKAKLFNSDSQLYKQAGNSIVVDVLEGIFEQLFKD